MDTLKNPAVHRTARRRGLVALASCVVAFVGMAWVLARADQTIYRSIPEGELDPFDGVATLVILVYAVVCGLVPLIMTIYALMSRGSRTDRSALAAAIYTATCGVVAGGLWFALNDDPRATDAALARSDQLSLLAILITLLPLLPALYARSRAR